jgi:hypothetical protein
MTAGSDARLLAGPPDVAAWVAPMTAHRGTGEWR